MFSHLWNKEPINYITSYELVTKLIIKVVINLVREALMILFLDRLKLWPLKDPKMGQSRWIDLQSEGAPLYSVMMDFFCR